VLELRRLTRWMIGPGAIGIPLPTNIFGGQSCWRFYRGCRQRPTGVGYGEYVSGSGIPEPEPEPGQAFRILQIILAYTDFKALGLWPENS